MSGENIYIYTNLQGGAPLNTAPPAPSFLGRYGSRYNGFAYCARNTSRPTAEQQEFAALIRTAPTAERKRYYRGYSTACECVQSIYYFLVVSRPKGQISLDIYVGYSFVSSYVNVQIGCWLISFGHSLGSWVSQQRSTLRRNKSLILPSHSPFMSSTRYKQRSRTDNTRHHRLLPPSAGQNSSGRTHSSVVPRNGLSKAKHTR